jgi:hypothetical protein
VIAIAATSCGGDDAPGASASTGRVATTAQPASTTVAPTTAPPATDRFVEPDCDGGDVIAEGELAPGVAFTMTESTDHRVVCLRTGSGPSPALVTLGDGPPPGAPAVRSSGTSGNRGMHHVVALPAGSTVVAARDETGAALVAGRTADGRHLVIYDHGVTAAFDARTELVTRVWDLLDANGAIVDQIEVHGPAAGSAAADVDDVLGCIRAAGLDVPDPPSMGPDDTAPVHATVAPGAPPRAAQPFAPDVATSAWAGCRDLHRGAMRASGMSAPQVDEVMIFLDCMATYGFIQSFLGEDVDRAAHAAASAACSTPDSGAVALTCDAFVIAPDGTLGAAPVRSGAQGYSTVADADAPAQAAAGQPFGVTLPSTTLRLTDRADEFTVVAQRDFVRTFRVDGGTVTPGSATLSAPSTTSTVTSDATTVVQHDAIEGPGGGSITFPQAQFEVAGTTAGTDVNVSVAGHENTLELATADGTTILVRAVCVPAPNVLATTVVR